MGLREDPHPVEPPDTLGGYRGPSVDADPCSADLRTRWVLAWMGVLVGAACLLLVLLLKKEDMKGEWCLPGGCAQPGNPPGDPASLLVLPTGWLKSLRADYGSEGESGASLGSGAVGGRDWGT